MTSWSSERSKFTSFAADETRAADDDDFHILVFGFRCFVFHSHCIVVALWVSAKRFSIAECFELTCFHACNPMA